MPSDDRVAAVAASAGDVSADSRRILVRRCKPLDLEGYLATPHDQLAVACVLRDKLISDLRDDLRNAVC